MAKKKKSKPWSPVRHNQIFLKTRGHRVDIHVYPVLQRLWDARIQTFFSCQGGADRFYDGGRVKAERAMVVILEKDADEVLEILKHLNPTREKWENRHRRDRCAIKFDPSEEAQAVHVWVTAE